MIEGTGAVAGAPATLTGRGVATGEGLWLVCGTTELDLLAGDSGIDLPVDNWLPKVATPLLDRLPEPVVEEIPVRIRHNSTDELATVMQTLHLIQSQANTKLRGQMYEPTTWLVCKLEKETGVRRVAARNIDFRYATPWFNSQSDPNILFGHLTIEREPYWESYEWESLGSETEDWVMGGTLGDAYEYGLQVVGDVPARPVGLYIFGLPDQRYVWGGFRSADKHGDLDYFVSRWECELGDAAVDASLATDATASPGGEGDTKLVVSFATNAGWEHRWSGWLDQYIDPEHVAENYGRFLVLLRAKVDAGTTAEVNLQSGYLWSFDRNPTRRVRITSNEWALHVAGIVEVPAGGEEAAVEEGADETQLFQHLMIYGRRVAGTGSLHLDCLVFIPIDEMSFSLVSQTESEDDLGATYALSMSPFGRWSCTLSRWYTLGTPEEPVMRYVIDSIPHLSCSGIGVPRGPGRLYLASARAGGVSVLDDEMGVWLALCNRWTSLRGNT